MTCDATAQDRLYQEEYRKVYIIQETNIRFIHFIYLALLKHCLFKLTSTRFRFLEMKGVENGLASRCEGGPKFFEPVDEKPKARDCSGKGDIESK